MRFDTVIVGGGLAGLSCGVALQRAGQRTAVVSAGQSALHFMSGGFELLARAEGREVLRPAEAVEHLPEGHPYRRLGPAFNRYVASAKRFLESVGICVRGGDDVNHYRLTPLGGLQPVWLSVSDLVEVATPDDYREKRIGVVNFEGFLDFPSTLLSDKLRAQGAKVEELIVDLPGLSGLRENETEFRAVHLARYFAEIPHLETLIAALRDWSASNEILILPAVFDEHVQGNALQRLRAGMHCRVGCVATLPPSVIGMRVAAALRRAYTEAGGVALNNSEAVRGEVNAHRVAWLQTTTLGSDYLVAENFVLAGGKFYSKGLQSCRDGIREGVFGCDVLYDSPRDAWSEETFFADQAFARYGVQVDDRFRALQGGVPLRNAYAIGSVLGGFDALAEGSGAGVALLTALRVADEISNGRGNGI